MQYIKRYCPNMKRTYWFDANTEKRLPYNISNTKMVELAYFILDDNNTIIKSRWTLEEVFDLAIAYI